MRSFLFLSYVGAICFLVPVMGAGGIAACFPAPYSLLVAGLGSIGLHILGCAVVSNTIEVEL